ncbi:MAG: alpha/beta hydrolase, partial [Candidatus Omnitrophica bacterium]|nr:alpha/beta hydrolase [Candidatus Omnitrophota bacterium]
MPIGLIATLLIPMAAFGANEPERQADLEQLRKILPESQAWEEWLQKTGELPPDFDAMPSIPYLPDPLIRADGAPIADREQWQSQRDELMVLIQHYITGTPAPAPGNVEAAQIDERKEGDLTIQDIVLKFGPDRAASLNMQLILPPGDGPFPVFMTQDNHYRWALIAAARGYIGCVYAGADSRDDTGAYISIWPDSDWTKLTRRAWAASRCIDYLETLDAADASKICLTGHSRNGKLSIIGGCLDPRITAVISSSS